MSLPWNLCQYFVGKFLGLNCFLCCLIFGDYHPVQSSINLGETKFSSSLYYIELRPDYFRQQSQYLREPILSSHQRIIYE